MSVFEDLKENIVTQVKALSEKIQESPLYIRATEQFQNLSPNMQKITLSGGALLGLGILLSIPWSNYTLSMASVESFEGTRQTIRDLLKVSREVKDIPNIPQPPDVNDLRNQVQGLLSAGRLLPEQIRGIDNTSNSSRLIPANLNQGTLSVSLTQLNLRQVIDIAHQLQTIHQSIKMTDMEIIANSKNSHYFDVIYKLAVLLVPQYKEPTPDPEPSKNKKDKKPKDSENG